MNCVDAEKSSRWRSVSRREKENLAKRRGIGTRGDGAPGASLGAAPDSDDEGTNTESQVRSLDHIKHSDAMKMLTCNTAE